MFNKKVEFDRADVIFPFYVQFKTATQVYLCVILKTQTPNQIQISFSYPKRKGLQNIEMRAESVI